MSTHADSTTSMHSVRTRHDNPVRDFLSSKAASIAVFIIATLWTIPTFGLLVSSVRTKDAVTSTGWWTALQNPAWTIDNYKQVLLGGGDNLQVPLVNYVVNSLAITVPATIIPITLAAMAAYAIAWVPFRGSDAVFFTIFGLQVVPLQMSLIPLLSLFSQGWSIGRFTVIPTFDNGLTLFGHQVLPAFKIAGNYAAIWLPHTMFALPLAIFLIHNFIAALPRELMEASKVDGANHFLTFTRVVLPLSVPALASFAIFQFLWVWNDLLVGMTFAGGSDAIMPLTYRLAQLSGSLGSHWELLTASAFIAMLIPLIVFFSLQRFFVRGLLAGSVKS